MIDERRLSAHLDWPLLAAVVALTLIGLATIYSVTWDFRPSQPARPAVLVAALCAAGGPGRAGRRWPSTTARSRSAR